MDLIEKVRQKLLGEIIQPLEAMSMEGKVAFAGLSLQSVPTRDVHAGYAGQVQTKMPV